MTKGRHKEIITYLKKLDRELYKFADSTRLHPNDVPKLVLLSQAAKFHTTFGSIIVLLSKLLPQDAEILLRSALNNLINASWIQKKEVNLRSRRFVEYSVILQDKFVRNAKKYKKSSPLVKEKAKEVKDNLSALTTKFGKNTTDWAGNSIKQRSRETNHGWDYDFVYFLASTKEHSDIISLTPHLNINKVSKQIELKAGPTTKDLDAVAVASSKYAVEMLILLNKTFSLKKRRKVRKLVNEFMTIFKKEKDA